jgi:hypothetical protein
MRLAQQTIDALEEQMCGFRGLTDGEGNYTFYATENNTEVEVQVELRYYPPYGIYVKTFAIDAYEDGDWVEMEATQTNQMENFAKELVRDYYHYD